MQGFFGIFSGASSLERGFSIVSGGTFPTFLSSPRSGLPPDPAAGPELFLLPVNPSPPTEPSSD